MWDAPNLNIRVIEHGVMPASQHYTGALNRGIVVINNLPTRGRLLGLDIFEEVREHVPLDLVGMGAEDYGIGEVLHPDLPAFISQYRFFFNPIRYTSLGLAVCEAMMQGMPIVGLATTEMAVTIKNGYSGFINTNIAELILNMKLLLNEPGLAKEMGDRAKETAQEKFNIQRFSRDWEKPFHEVAAKKFEYNLN